MAETASLSTKPIQTAAVKKTADTQPVRTERVLFNPPIGLPLQWFAHGDPTEKPLRAVCIDTFGRDMITIRVTANNGDHEWTVRNCPHMSDPMLIARKTKIPGPPIGAWDFIPGFVPTEYRKVDSIRYRIVLLYQLHSYNAYQIASALKGDWTEAKVQEVLDEHATNPKG